MQFKQVNKRIYVLVYRGRDQDKNRARVKMAGKLDENLRPMNGLIEFLTNNEKVELIDFIAKETARRDMNKRIEAATNLPENIELTIGAFEHEFKPTTEWRRRVLAATTKLSSLIGKE